METIAQLVFPKRLPAEESAITRRCGIAEIVRGSISRYHWYAWPYVLVRRYGTPVSLPRTKGQRGG